MEKARAIHEKVSAIATSDSKSKGESAGTNEFKVNVAQVKMISE